MPTFDVEQGREALFYQREKEGRVLCQLCPHECRIDLAKRGICRVRENRQGTLYTLVYGQTWAEHIDPVEKKPLFHFYPGTTTYSIAAYSCNFHCACCTNWELSQLSPEQSFLLDRNNSAPEHLVERARIAGCRSLAYTYVEPTIFFEYLYDTARLAHAAGLFNIYKTNGFMSTQMLELSHPYFQAANVDLKSFRDKTYRGFGGRLPPVLLSLKRMKALGIWLEITTLIIPGLNDDSSELQDIVEFIVTELGKETPWHIARFFPAYQMSHFPPTPIATLARAQEIGIAGGLQHIYLPGKQDTLCHHCGRVLIRRSGGQWLASEVKGKGCLDCGSPLAGIGLEEVA